MGGKRLFWHLAVVALELAVLLFLIDANTAFACNWCATPPAPQPVLPSSIWRTLRELIAGPSQPWEICPPPNLGIEGLIIAAGLLFVGHAVFLLHRSAVE